VLKKHIGEITYNNAPAFRNDALKAMTEYASLNRQGWTMVEDGLPTENDTSDYWYDEVMTLQVGRRRPTFMKYWEVKNCPFTKYWMPLPNKPI